MCDPDGRPIAIEVFPGNTGDPKTLKSQVEKLRNRFALKHVVIVADRGMVTSARIREDLRDVDGLEWISALRAPQIRALLDAGAPQLSLFDDRDLGEIRSESHPGERLIACRNPLLAEERARKRNELLAATERKLDEVLRATTRKKRPLRGKDKIGKRLGAVCNKYKVAKHFHFKITETSFSYTRKEEQIAAEAALDGIYVVRTSAPEQVLSTEQTVQSYKSLSRVERAFRTMKTVDLKIRPIHHNLEDRVRCHVFICMLAYYVEWHMREALAPLLFDDEDYEAAQALRRSVVAPAQRSASALNKARTKTNSEGQTVHSFRTLLADLATIVRNTCRATCVEAPDFEKTTTPTPLQQRALDLLGVSLHP
jgi:transposase